MSTRMSKKKMFFFMKDAHSFGYTFPKKILYNILESILESIYWSPPPPLIPNNLFEFNNDKDPGQR